MSIRRLMLVGVVCAMCLALSLTWLRGAPATNDAAAGGMHFLAYLSTDKPIYRDGEKVYFRAVVLGADDHRPLPEAQPAFAALQVTGPKGEILFNSWDQSEQSVAALNWEVPADAAGGQYKATVSFPNNGFPPAERKFEVRAYPRPVHAFCLPLSRYSHERRSLHTWITDPGCANGYCTWALLECGEKNLDKEVGWLKDRAGSDPNSYVTALAANVMFLAGDKDAAKTFMDKLAKHQDKDGHVLGATTSVVGSEGDSLQIETTSLATLAWLRDPAYAGNVEQAIHFLADSCQGGRYGSTQSTVLALRAIVAYDKARAHPTAAGSIQLIVDERSVGSALSFDEHSQGAIKLPDFADQMTPGKHNVELKMSDGSSLPFAVAVNFNSEIPASSDQCKLSITTELKDAEVAEAAVTEADVTVTNLTDQTVPTPIAIIGLPGGLEVRYDQLKELVKADRIAAYEVRGREVILYWRDLQPKESVQIPLSVIAAVPGIYTGPASRAYLYYSDEFKQWSPGMKGTIDAK